jgi:hypothetical protein
MRIETSQRLRNELKTCDHANTVNVNWDPIQILHLVESRSSAYATFLARIKNYRRVAIWIAKWRYGGRGVPSERSESQSKQGVRGQRFFLASINKPIYITANLIFAMLPATHVASHACHSSSSTSTSSTCAAPSGPRALLLPAAARLAGRPGGDTNIRLAGRPSRQWSVARAGPSRSRRIGGHAGPQILFFRTLMIFIALMISLFSDDLFVLTLFLPCSYLVLTCSYLVLTREGAFAPSFLSHFDDTVWTGVAIRGQNGLLRYRDIAISPLMKALQ